MPPVPCSLSPDLSPLSPVSCLLRFRLRGETAIEDFGDRSLVLLCDSLRLREINEPSRRILGQLDGGRAVPDIAAATGLEPAVVLEALLEMERQGIVQRVVEMTTERPTDMNSVQYLRNPDVSFRQEDDDGGILFNPDTDALEVINPTAVAIWLFLAAPHTAPEVVTHLCAVCEGAARQPVERDVADFLESLLAKGFIGVVEERA